MMNKEYINYGDTTLPVDTAVIENKYNAKYIADFALKTVGGGWSESPGQIYWQPKPPVEGYSHYFAVVLQRGQVFITSAQCLENLEFVGIKSGDEIIFSRYRHDYRSTADGKCTIDGGMDYVKVGNFPEEFVSMKLNGPVLEVFSRKKPD